MTRRGGRGGKDKKIRWNEENVSGKKEKRIEKYDKKGKYEKIKEKEKKYQKTK